LPLDAWKNFKSQGAHPIMTNWLSCTKRKKID